MQITFKCKNCGEINCIDVDNILDITNNNDLMKRILDNSAFIFNCRKCQAEHNVIYDALIENNNLKYYLKINTSNQLLALMPENDYKIRIVKDLNEANEKIRCFNYLLDDRLVEIIKYLLKENLESNNEGLKITEIYFFRVVDNNLEFVLFQDDDYKGIMRYSFTGYNHLNEIFKQYFDDNIQVVDKNYAISIITKAKENQNNA